MSFAETPGSLGQTEIGGPEGRLLSLPDGLTKLEVATFVTQIGPRDRFRLQRYHSSRSNRAGSTDMDCRAGIQVATRPSKAIVNIDPPSTSGSCGVAS